MAASAGPRRRLPPNVVRKGLLMRYFALETGSGRKFVVIELRGPVMRVVQGKPDGSTVRSEKGLASEAQARAAADRMAAELAARGFVEQVSEPEAGRGPAPATSASRPSVASARDKGAADGLDLDALAEAADGLAEELAPLRRLGPIPGEGAGEAAPKARKKKKAGTRKRKAKGAVAGAEPLDKRVIAGVVSLALGCFAFVGHLGYDAFLKPPTIVGHWEGGRTEHEVGKFLTHTNYTLILDARRNAAMAVDKLQSAGTYAVRGDRLELTFKDEDGEVTETAYRIALGRSTLDLFDPATGRKVVELIRFKAKSDAVVGGAGASPARPAEAPQGLGDGPANPAADAQLASVPFAPKDAAFQLRRPAGWEVEGGSRPDNTYSWARFTRDSAKVQVLADIAGSLMTGSNQADHEEGSRLAPVHAAHELNARKVAEDYSDYQESEPAVFKGSTLGEGRVAAFTASTGGLLGSKVRGVRITLLTNDRRITVLCECPTTQFDKYKPTFLAIARSLGR